MKKIIFFNEKFRAITHVLNSFQTIFEGVEQVETSLQNLFENSTQINEMVTDLMVPHTALKIKRVKARKELIAELGNILNITHMFANSINNDVLLHTIKNFLSKYRSVSAYEMIEMSNHLITSLSENEELLNRVGLTAAHLQLLQNKCDAYRLAMTEVETIMSGRTKSREIIKELIKANNSLLANNIDRFIRFQAVLNPELSYAYKRVRWIRQRRKGSKTPLNGNADISGIVSDSKTGMVIPGVTLNLIEQAWAIQTETDGYYLFDELDEGTYTIGCHAPGYHIPETFQITLKNNESIIQNFELTPLNNQ